MRYVELLSEIVENHVQSLLGIVLIGRPYPVCGNEFDQINSAMAQISAGLTASRPCSPIGGSAKCGAELLLELHFADPPFSWKPVPSTEEPQ